MTFKRRDEEVVLTPKTRVPLYVVGSFLMMAVYITALFMKLDADIGNSMAKDQFQAWVDSAREKNRIAYPALTWPSVPPRDKSESVKMPPFAKE